MNQTIRQSLAAAVLASATALPAAAASNDEIAKATVARAAVGVTRCGMALAAPGLFVALTVFGTGLMVKTIPDGMNRPNPYAQLRRPTRQEQAGFEQSAFVDGSAFPASTGSFGGFIPTATSSLGGSNPGEARPGLERQAFVDASTFPSSTGLYGALIPTATTGK